MSINEGKLEKWCKQLEMWCEQTDKRLDGLERKTESIGSIASTITRDYARESCLPEPDEPLIEHEIVRKALRWWAVSNGITGDASLLFVGAANGFTCENQYISFDSAVYDMSEKLISGNIYDLEELCGEEEE